MKQIDILKTPQWIAVRTAIVDAVKDHPAARRALLKKLAAVTSRKADA